MKVVPNFLPSDLGSRQHAANTAGMKTPTIITVSNGFAGRKNVASGLRAFSALREKGIAVEYELVGAELGPGEAAETYARQNGLEEGVRFVGPMTSQETMARIGSAALLIHPALEESFGMTVLESMALGTPVVAGASAGNVPELLDGGACGYV